MNVDPEKTTRLLGIFESNHCPFHKEIERYQIADKEPTLLDMLDKAIDILKKDDNGFFLFVEAGRIDHAHHDTRAEYALDETVQLSLAVTLAKQKLSEEDTIFIVTADHSHTLSYSGYGVSALSLNNTVYIFKNIFFFYRIEEMIL